MDYGNNLTTAQVAGKLPRFFFAPVRRIRAHVALSGGVGDDQPQHCNDRGRGHGLLHQA